MTELGRTRTYLRVDHCVTPAGIEISPYYVLSYPDWVHVVGITEAGSWVLVQQYRHAARHARLRPSLGPSGRWALKSNYRRLAGVRHELTFTSRCFGANCSFDPAATNDLNDRQFGRQLPRSQLKLRCVAQIRQQFGSRARQIHADCGAFANRAVDFYSAARLASHPVHLAQPET
jgi:hypothetical protein